MKRRCRAALVLLGIVSAPAYAHAVGARHDLTAPLGYFVAGAALTVLLTFVVAVVGVRRTGPQPAELASFAAPAALRPVGLALRGAALALFLLVIASGLFGDPHPARNIAPTAVWIVGWVGLSLGSALFVNLWPAIDPWASLHCLIDRGRPPRPWPSRWGAKPAVLLFLLFAWFEVVDPLSSRPSYLAWLLIAWTAVNVSGMLRFGRAAWQRQADPLAIYFATLGRFAPLAIEDGRLVVRPWARALVSLPSSAPTAFVVAMLATVLFDGLLGTQFWRGVETAFGTLAPGWNDRHNVVIGTLGLAITVALFLLAYRLACTATAALAAEHSTARIGAVFAPTLVPIAVAYLVAHNLTYLLVQGQGIVPFLSDPFGRSWNLFGTAHFTPDIEIVGARFAWLTAAIAIIGGHVISVWLAHRVALSTWSTRARAIRASLPLTLVMIGYTAVSLFVVAEPLTRYRTPDPGFTSLPSPLVAS